MDKKKYQCDICMTEFTLLKNLRRHNEAIHEGRKYHCKICLKSYRYKSTLGTHMKFIHLQKKNSM